ncbi:MAG TPA: hypothetical protein VFC09_08110 [Candidatus Dormibacteraeota bacterium]|nr:hypothetical protein [Candidatus Dormibacteraeota bacterium]
MLRAVRTAAAGVLGLFMTGWVSAAIALCVLAGGWALARAFPGAAAGFAMAGALALLVVGEALLRGRR